MIVVSDTSCISNLLSIGLLSAISPILQQLENDAGFYLSASLKENVLLAVGEA